jgi:hypothetical protein
MIKFFTHRVQLLYWDRKPSKNQLEGLSSLNMVLLVVLGSRLEGVDRREDEGGEGFVGHGVELWGGGLV